MSSSPRQRIFTLTLKQAKIFTADTTSTNLFPTGTALQPGAAAGRFEFIFEAGFLGSIEFVLKQISVALGIGFTTSQVPSTTDVAGVLFVTALCGTDVIAHPVQARVFTGDTDPVISAVVYAPVDLVMPINSSVVKMGVHLPDWATFGQAQVADPATKATVFLAGPTN